MKFYEIDFRYKSILILSVLITILSFVELKIESEFLLPSVPIDIVQNVETNSCITMEELFSESCKNIEDSYTKITPKKNSTFFPTLNVTLNKQSNFLSSKIHIFMFNLVISMFDISPFIAEKAIFIEIAFILEIYFLNFELLFKNKYLTSLYKNFIFVNIVQIFRPPILTQL